MIKDDFWFISLCCLWIMTAQFPGSIFLRIATAANALIVIISLIRRRAEEYGHGKKENRTHLHRS